MAAATSKQLMENLLNQIDRGNDERAELIGRALWRRGLNIQRHRMRVDAEQAEAAKRHRRSMDDASRRRPKSRSKVDRIKNRNREWVADVRAWVKEQTCAG